MNCVKHHIRKRDTTKRCFICIEIGHVSMKCINIRIIEDEKKARANNIKKKMRHQWIPKPLGNTSQSKIEHVTQELGDTTIST